MSDTTAAQKKDVDLVISYTVAHTSWVGDGEDYKRLLAALEDGHRVRDIIATPMGAAGGTSGSAGLVCVTVFLERAGHAQGNSRYHTWKA